MLHFCRFEDTLACSRHACDRKGFKCQCFVYLIVSIVGTMGLPTTVLLHLTLVTLTLAVSEDSTLQLSRQKSKQEAF